MGFRPHTQKLEQPCTAKQTAALEVLLSSFHLNGHTMGFHPQTQKLEPPCTA